MSGESPALIQQLWNSPYWEGFAQIAVGVLWGGFATALLLGGLSHVIEYSVSNDLATEMLIAGGLFGLFLLMGVIAGVLMFAIGIYAGSRTILREVRTDAA